MKRTTIALLFSIAAFCVFRVFAEEDEHEERKSSPQVTSELYKTNCGACHFTYPLRLLPTQSWLLIIDQPGRHAGGDLDLDAKSRADLKKFFTDNSGNNSHGKRSKRPAAPTTGTNVAIRISELPHIKEKHREIKPEVFARKSIGSRGNCIACHKSADKGDFDEDTVRIPKQ